MPVHPADVYLKPYAPLAFLVTFLVVASTWYSHHWLFDHLFVPKPATITINFATLASIVWLVYQLQLYVHFVTSAVDSRFATTAYLVTFAVSWLLLALLYGMCLKLRWSDLPAEDRRFAIFKTGRLAFIGISTLVAVTVMLAFKQPLQNTIWLVLAAGAAWRLWSARWVKDVAG